MTDINAIKTDTKRPSYDDYLFETALQELNQLISHIGDPIKNKDVSYLLNLWCYFSIYQLNPDSDQGEKEEEGSGSGESENEVLPRITRIKGGWKVLDYGDGLITSSGENYGSYSTSALLKTAKYMVDCLVKRGAKTVIFSGASPAKRLAWIECQRLGIKNRFNPNNQDIKCQERLSKILEGRFLSFKL